MYEQQCVPKGAVVRLGQTAELFVANPMSTELSGWMYETNAPTKHHTQVLRGWSHLSNSKAVCCMPRAGQL